MEPSHPIKKIILIGPAHPLRGGLATFDHRLARQFSDEGFQCKIYSFSLQYPSFLFPGKSQFSEEKPPEGIPIFSKINSINPLNWVAVGNALAKEKADLIIIRYWLPFMGPALGTIARRIRKNKHSKIIAITDNVLPHEKRPGDHAFTKYFLNSCDAFVTMSDEVLQDLRQFEKEKPAVRVLHPLYDNFGEKIDKTAARRHLGLPENGDLILFFGFIRKYKGLDLLLEAMSLVKEKRTIKLIIAGEFYEEKEQYEKMIKDLEIEDTLIMRTEFIPDSEVRYYLSAADAVIQPYRNATQSGVTPLAYHFEKPMIITNVGGLPELVPHRKAGLVTEPEPKAIAQAILEFYELGEHYFIPHLRSEKTKHSWHTLVETLINLAGKIYKQ